MEKFFFNEPLIEGIIKNRPNRFIMNVKIKNAVEKAHCPVTGRIGNIKFTDIPCLLSKSHNKERKTKYTVEAIKLGDEWIGINQSKANDYANTFLLGNCLKKIFKNVTRVKREVTAGKSRIDFLVNEKDYVEVKTPLMMLQMKHKVNYETIKEAPFKDFHRLIKHFNEIASHVPEGSRAIVVMFYMYDATKFVPPELDKGTIKIQREAGKALRKGVEMWQVNAKIDNEGLELLDCFPLHIKKALKKRL